MTRCIAIVAAQVTIIGLCEESYTKPCRICGLGSQSRDGPICVSGLGVIITINLFYISPNNKDICDKNTEKHQTHALKYPKNGAKKNLHRNRWQRSTSEIYGLKMNKKIMD